MPYIILKNPHLVEDNGTTLYARLTPSGTLDWCTSAIMLSAHEADAVMARCAVAGVSAQRLETAEEIPGKSDENVTHLKFDDEIGKSNGDLGLSEGFVLDFIREHPWCDENDLIAAHGDCGQAVRSLTRKGLIESVGQTRFATAGTPRPQINEVDPEAGVIHRIRDALSRLDHADSRVRQFINQVADPFIENLEELIENLETWHPAGSDEEVLQVYNNWVFENEIKSILSQGGGFRMFRQQWENNEIPEAAQDTQQLIDLLDLHGNDGDCPIRRDEHGDFWIEGEK